MNSTGRASRSLGAGSRRNRKHGIHDGPGAHIHQTSNQRDGSVDSGLLGWKEMIHQHDVEIIDDDLAREKYDRLQALSGRKSRRNWLAQRQAGAWLRAEIRSDDGDHARQDCSLYAKSETDKQVSSAEANYSFQHEVDGQRTEGMDSLNVASPHSKRNVERRSQAQQRDQKRIGQIQVCCRSRH